MVNGLIQVLIELIILGVIWWAIQQVMALVPLAEPFRTIVRVVMVVIAVIITLYILLDLLSLLGVGGGAGHLLSRR